MVASSWFRGSCSKMFYILATLKISDYFQENIDHGSPFQTATSCLCTPTWIFSLWYSNIFRRSILTHSIPLVSFNTHWKHFQGVLNETSDMKWVKEYCKVPALLLINFSFTIMTLWLSISDFLCMKEVIIRFLRRQHFV